MVSFRFSSSNNANMIIIIFDALAQLHKNFHLFGGTIYEDQKRYCFCFYFYLPQWNDFEYGGGDNDDDDDNNIDRHGKSNTPHTAHKYTGSFISPFVQNIHIYSYICTR